VPDLATVLECIASDLVAEKASYADTLPAHNPVLLETVRRLFPDAEHEMIPHDSSWDRWRPRPR
jgi:D-ribose pyranose/furanose isomerase RbsD